MSAYETLVPVALNTPVEESIDKPEPTLIAPATEEVAYDTVITPLASTDIPAPGLTPPIVDAVATSNENL